MQFTDSIEGNLELIQQIISDAPPSERGKIQSAYKAIQKACLTLQRDNGRCRATALGITLAAHTVAQHLTKTAEPGEDGPRIQLLS